MRKLWEGVLTISGLAACPCHFPITLPLLVGALGGTGLGSFVAANTGLMYGVATAYFIAALGVGFILWNRRLRKAGAKSEMRDSDVAKGRSVLLKPKEVRRVADRATH